MAEASLPQQWSAADLLCDMIRRIRIDCERSSLNDENMADSIHFRIDYLIHTILRYEGVVPGLTSNLTGQLLPLLGEATTLLASNDLNLNDDQSRCNLIYNGKKGRPKFDITEDHLSFLLGLGFSVPLISSLLETSTRTVERRMAKYGLQSRSYYSTLSDAELDAIVGNIMHEFPNAGYTRMTGLLRSRGQIVQRERIRASMKRVNPEGVMLRSLHLSIIKRRKYCVKGPLALWHIDGNHKLIR